MAVTFEFKKSAISGGSDDRRVSHFAYQSGTSNDPNEIEILNAAELDLPRFPLFWDGMPREGFELEHILETETRPEQWIVTAVYRRSQGTRRDERPAVPSNTAEFNFDLNLTNVRFETAISQKGFFGQNGEQHKVADGSEFAGKGQPVNVQFTREAGLVSEGVDAQVPTSHFGLDFSMQQGVLNELYIQHVQGLVGKVNNKLFKGRKAGTVMLIGVSGRQRLKGESQISFRFEERRGGTIAQIGEGPDAIKNIPFDGFDYVWYYRGLQQGDDPRRPLLQPIRTVYVAKIFEEADLNGLFPPNLVIGSGGDFVTGHTGISVQGSVAA